MNTKLIRQYVQSRYIDMFGAVLIFVISYSLSFHETFYYQGKIEFYIPFSEWREYIRMGAFPLGLLSMTGAIFSILSTRFIGKQNNLGNVIGVLITISSGTIDYLFGNHSAIITYPLTFIIMNYATFNWYKGVKIRRIDRYYYMIMAIGMGVAYALVYLGFYLFGGRTDPLFTNIVAITFGLSLGANFCSALKYEETWLSWVIYNIVQLSKAILQINIANVAKYLFYLFNAGMTLMDWKWNGDVVKEGLASSKS